MIDFKTLKKNLKKDTRGLPIIKIALVGDTATQFLATAIIGMGVERGFHINLFEAEYNQVERQFLDPTSELYQFDADFIVVFQSAHKLGEHHSMLSMAEQAEVAEQRLQFVESICLNGTHIFNSYKWEGTKPPKIIILPIHVLGLVFLCAL